MATETGVQDRLSLVGRLWSSMVSSSGTKTCQFSASLNDPICLSPSLQSSCWRSWALEQQQPKQQQAETSCRPGALPILLPLNKSHHCFQATNLPPLFALSCHLPLLSTARLPSIPRHLPIRSSFAVRAVGRKVARGRAVVSRRPLRASDLCKGQSIALFLFQLFSILPYTASTMLAGGESTLVACGESVPQ